MPTYDYRCDACGHEFELYQQITAPVKRKCPECGKPRLQRLIGTGAGVIFKGGGFYETDYRSESYKKAAEADKKSAEPAAAKSEAKSDGAATSSTSKDGAKSKTDSASTSSEPRKSKSSKKSKSRDNQ
jgi:putative FmdB family regulatory protein